MPTTKTSFIKSTTAHSGDDNRVGIERAFDVIRNHTVHTKGYVMTAIQLIEECGTEQDKRALTELLTSKKQTK